MRMKILIALALVVFSVGVNTAYSEEEVWPGVDVTVVEKVAEENGRAASGPLLNVEGDLLLFAFLVAGVCGGFVLGYYYKEAFSASSAVRQNRVADAE